MKRIPLALLVLMLPCIAMTCKNNNQAAYQTIGATEQAVLAANMAYLDSVVTGRTATNSVPTVEAAFNATQLALRSAAAVASGGTNAAVPATVMAQATAFTNVINTAQGK